MRPKNNLRVGALDSLDYANWKASADEDGMCCIVPLLLRVCDLLFHKRKGRL